MGREKKRRGGRGRAGKEREWMEDPLVLLPPKKFHSYATDDRRNHTKLIRAYIQH